MARKPRPVDPADGPIQAFAHDLRIVRERAGNPTYRVLAERAGFGATTLSDAAGGVRLPSLEVTQAYVGACGGDVEEWTRRWHEADRKLATPAPAPAAEPAAAEPAAAEPGAAEIGAVESAVRPGAVGTVAAPARTEKAVGAPAGSGPYEARPGNDLGDAAGVAVDASVDLVEPPATLLTRRWPARWTTAGTVALLALTAVIVLVALRSTSSEHGNARTAATGPTGVGCPAPAASPGLFGGETYNVVTRLRAGASLAADVVAQVPSGCKLAFTGYCLGDVVVDVTSGSPDIRWFRIATGGYVSSAVVHGNPPAGTQPVDCPDGIAPPSSITLTAGVRTGEPGTLELRATGNHVAIVGYAAYLPRAGSSTPQWQQLGITSESAAGFTVAWKPGSPAEGGGAGTPVVAVACLGGDGPTAVADSRLVGRNGTATAMTGSELSETELTRARKAACRYPDGKG
ncbi:helix-turn-helix transcriptional regulator [Kitasatospora sp. NPDC051914]|uniref:helix-turn-helix domain-containing protein n=1 Tax=Kitasatospora sp. NPDC051914 TaxID=3154945 RepID=UPI003414D3CC